MHHFNDTNLEYVELTSEWSLTKYISRYNMNNVFISRPHSFLCEKKKFIISFNFDSNLSCGIVRVYEVEKSKILAMSTSKKCLGF